MTITTWCDWLLIHDNRIDIKVLGVTCDGYSVNRRFLKIHASKKDTITHKMTNPFAPEQRDIFYISDPPHLIKTVRNSWASKKRNLWVRINTGLLASQWPSLSEWLYSVMEKQLTGSTWWTSTRMVREQTEWLLVCHCYPSSNMSTFISHPTPKWELIWPHRWSY